MTTRADLLVPGALQRPDGSPDYAHSVASKVVRCLHEGKRAVALGEDVGSKIQIAALLDLLELHRSGANAYQGQPVDPDEVVVLLGGRPNGRAEAVDALATLARAMCGGPTVRLLEQSFPDWGGVGDGSFDPADLSQYPSYPRLLARVPDQPPALVAGLVCEVGAEALRAYPMLAADAWSVRLEGLEVARLTASGGRLDVGGDGTAQTPGGAPAQSEARQVWQRSTGLSGAFPVDTTPQSVAAAVSHVKAFAAQWLTPVRPGGPLTQNEHALESRILRGAVPVSVEGVELQLLRGKHSTVNWGSQFPTKWGRNGSARYLDALLRDGRTPWAVEMKVSGGGGVGQYYRHAIAQAVLYREFIRGAAPLHFWFQAQGLDAGACRAAVVVPEMIGPSARWLPGLQGLCELFDVALVQVPACAAELR